MSPIPDPGAPSGTFAALERTQPTPALFSFGRGDEGADGFLRGAVIDGDPVFITADVLRLLDLNRSSVALLDDDEKGVHTLDTPGGRQEHSVITESGLYSLVLRSRKPEAKAIKRWITHDVLPAIRKTGTYSRYPAAPQHLPSKKELAQWVVEAEERAEAAEAKVRELHGPASAWNELAEAQGDYSVADAAKVLSRDPSITTGERRLFRSMQHFGWIYREGGRWRAYQRRVDDGRLVEKVGRPYLRNDVMQAGEPTVRITPKGLESLQKLLGGSGQLELMAAI